MEEGVHFTGRLSFPLDDDLGGGVTARLERRRGSDSEQNWKSSRYFDFHSRQSQQGFLQVCVTVTFCYVCVKDSLVSKQTGQPKLSVNWTGSDAHIIQWRILQLWLLFDVCRQVIHAFMYRVRHKMKLR